MNKKLKHISDKGKPITFVGVIYKTLEILGSCSCLDESQKQDVKSTILALEEIYDEATVKEANKAFD